MLVNKNTDIIIKKSALDHYYTYFNKNTGYFARIEERGYENPFWASQGPELLDISITNWCDRMCDFCYRQSSKEGIFMQLNDYEELISQAFEIGVYQVALGGGNPNQHPDFVKMLEITRKKYGIVPSYTTNGRGINNEILTATKEYCGAVAISLYPPYDDFVEAVQLYLNNNIKVNAHYVLNSNSVEKAIDWLNNPPDFLQNINALIFLNYKPVGRNVDNDLLLKNSKRTGEFFSAIAQRNYNFKIGFDSCCLSGIVKHMKIDEKYLEACEAGRFSAFISEDLILYPCSFMVSSSQGIDLRNTTIKEAWNQSELFENIRSKIRNNSCLVCTSKAICMGGCPIYKDVNLCGY